MINKPRIIKITIFIAVILFIIASNAYCKINIESGVPFDLQWGDDIKKISNKIEKYTGHCKIDKLNDGIYDYIFYSKVLFNGFPFTVFAFTKNNGLENFCLIADINKNEFKSQFTKANDAILDFLYTAKKLEHVEDIDEGDCIIQVNKCADNTFVIFATFINNDPIFIIQWKPINNYSILQKTKIYNDIEEIMNTLKSISQ